MTGRPSRQIVIALALAALTLAVYAPVRHFDFVQVDDPLYVIENPNVRGGLTMDGIVWAFTTGRAANWHPVTWLSHMLDVQAFGVDPGWHHLTSLLLHVANALLLFGLLVSLTGATWRSALVAALFAVHPLHVESVAWVAERKDVLSTFFWLLTTWAYVGFVRAGGRRDGPLRADARALRPRPDGEADARHAAFRPAAARRLAARAVARCRSGHRQGRPRRTPSEGQASPDPTGGDDRIHRRGMAPRAREDPAVRHGRRVQRRDGHGAGERRGRDRAERRPARSPHPERARVHRAVPSGHVLAGRPDDAVPLSDEPSGLAGDGRPRRRRQRQLAGLAPTADSPLAARRVAVVPGHARPGVRHRSRRSPGACRPVHVRAAHRVLHRPGVGRRGPCRTRRRGFARRSPRRPSSRCSAAPGWRARRRMSGKTTSRSGLARRCRR